MNAIFLNGEEICLSLTPAACAELRAMLGGKRPPVSIRLCSDAADGAAQKRHFSFLKEHSRFQHRAHWPEVTYLHTLTVRKGKSGSWLPQGREAELVLPPNDWLLFCAALEHFLNGYWLFFIELPSCGLLINFASHGADEDAAKMEDGRF